MKTFALPLNLQLFSDEMGAADPGVETAPAAEVQANEETADTTGANQEAAAEPEKQNNFEKAFAKRLAEAEKKWQAETSEKYKDYDTVKDVADYFREINQVPDMMSLKERIELERLQDRAEQQNVPPEVLKRIDELEVKAAKADEFEQQQAQAKTLQSFESGLKEFVKDKQIGDKPVDHMELWQYMHENGVSKPEVAYKAMKADILEQKLATSKEDSIKEYLASKKGPRVEGSQGAAGSQSVDTSKMSWKEIEKHAVARLEASRTPQ